MLLLLVYQFSLEHYINIALLLLICIFNSPNQVEDWIFILVLFLIPLQLERLFPLGVQEGQVAYNKVDNGPNNDIEDHHKP